MESNYYTVSGITGYIKTIFAGDDRLQDLWITGEISNFYHHNSGHMYFSLKDDNAKIDGVMFKSRNKNLKFTPEDGLEINAHGYINVYAPRGTYQLYVDKMEPKGKGSLYLAFKQLKERLENEGLFAPEYKKTIPLLPSRIGIVTSPDGAAIRDILSVVNRRFDNVSILIVPTLVQGDKAASEIVKGINYLNKRDDIDLIIISRGGGSIEDLWPFNEEVVARSIFTSKIPVISGVGHETDFTISDFVADLRAPTPSAAAELAISSREELENNINNLQNRLLNVIENMLNKYRDRVKSLATKRVFTQPEELFLDQIMKLDDLGKRIKWVIEKRLNRSRERFNIISGKLETLSPLKTLKRGYSISSDPRGKIIKSIDQVGEDDYLLTRVTDGIIKSQIYDKERDDEKYG